MNSEYLAAGGLTPIDNFRRFLTQASLGLTAEQIELCAKDLLLVWDEPARRAMARHEDFIWRTWMKSNASCRTG